MTVGGVWGVKPSHYLPGFFLLVELIDGVVHLVILTAVDRVSKSCTKTAVMFQ